MGKVLKPVQRGWWSDLAASYAAQTGKTSIARALLTRYGRQWRSSRIVIGVGSFRGVVVLLQGIQGRATFLLHSVQGVADGPKPSFKGVLTFFATAGSKNSRAVARITARGWQQPYHHLNKRKTNPQQTEIRMPLNWRPVCFSNGRHAVAHSCSSSSARLTSSLSYLSTS